MASITPNALLGLPNLNVEKNNVIDWTLPSGIFSAIIGDVTGVTYSATLKNGDPLPSWLTFDPNSTTLTGTPPDGKDVVVTITATNILGIKASLDLDIIVNAPPAAGTALADVNTEKGKTFNWTLPSDSFTDDDIVEGDKLTYSVTLKDGSPLPSWLIFNPITGKLTGTPPDGKDIVVTVTATDKAGDKASQDLNIIVNTPPETGTALADVSAKRGNVFSWTLPSGSFKDDDISRRR